jgi:CubicO group peptidase (beta-lactamase class C family)
MTTSENSTVQESRFTVTTVEPVGEYAGEEMGRVWLLHGGRSEWAGLGSVDAARHAVEELKGKPLADVRAWFDAQ